MTKKQENKWKIWSPIFFFFTSAICLGLGTSLWIISVAKNIRGTELAVNYQMYGSFLLIIGLVTYVIFRFTGEQIPLIEAYGG